MSDRASDATPIIIDVPVNVGDADVRRALLERVRTLVARPPTHILLNVEALKAADTEQLGAIIQAYIIVTKNGGAVGLVNVTPRLRRLLTITKVDKIIGAVTPDG